MQDCLVLGIVTVTVLLAIRSIVNDKKAGNSSCGNRCGGCAISGFCHQTSGSTLKTDWYKDHPRSVKS